MIAYATIKQGSREELEKLQEQIHAAGRKGQDIYQYKNSQGKYEVVGRVILTRIEDDKLIAEMEIKGDITQDMQEQLEITIRPEKNPIEKLLEKVKHV